MNITTPASTVRYPVTGSVANHRTALNATNPPAAFEGGVEESKGNEDAALRHQIIPEGFSNLPQDVVLEILPYLTLNDIGAFAQVSKVFKNDVEIENQHAIKKLPDLIEKVNALIQDSGITGIKMPAGPFNNSIHQLRVLTSFKDALPNAIKVLKDNDITYMNAPDNDGWTPLHRAAQEGHTEVIEALIDAGAKVNAQDNNGITPLHRAAIYGQTEVIEALITAGAKVNAQDNVCGRTPLHRTAIFGHTEIARALIAAGADVDAPNNYGSTPLHRAAQEGHTKVILALIDAGAEVNAQDNYGGTPLHRAAFYGHTTIVQALIDAGAEVDAKDNRRRTPLHWAARIGQTTIARALIDAGANVHATNDEGWTPLRLATENGHAELVSLLTDSIDDQQRCFSIRCTIM